MLGTYTLSLTQRIYILSFEKNGNQEAHFLAS